MSEIKHTPGPWWYGLDRGGRARVFAGDYEIVKAMASNGDRRLSESERQANAHLIAAAPEMYEALIALNLELDAYWNDQSQAGSRPPESYIQRITAAQIRCAAVLAKAEGAQ